MLPIIIILLGIAVFFGVEASIAKNRADAVKDGLKNVLACVKDKDAFAAEEALVKTDNSETKLKETFESPFWRVAGKFGFVRQYLDSADDLMETLDYVEDKFLWPLIEIMKEYPLSDLKVGDGFNVTLMNRYLDFVEEVQPEIDTLLLKLDDFESSPLLGGYITKYKDKIAELMGAYRDASAMLPLLRTFLGDGSDRLYLLAAQNSAEIRASGGFPGSFGTIRIKDGVLTIGDFNSVYYTLAPYISSKSEVTADEERIYGSWVNAPRDACFIPDFERTAKIWDVAYEEYLLEDGTENGYVRRQYTTNEETGEEEESLYFYDEETGETAPYKECDGVVSLTPAIIQMLLRDVGELTLSDGTVLNDQNATKVLQYDLYYRFFAASGDAFEGNYMSDILFAETAKTVMSEFVSRFEISKFADYYNLFMEGAEKNIIMMWMDDEDEQYLVEEAGLSGRLNYKEDEPFIGVYFSLSDPCKLGWFLDMVVDVSDPYYDEEGNRTYDVKVSLNNTISDDDLQHSGWYILGSYGGTITGYIHCFAPYGGHIYDFDTSNGLYMNEDEYHDLELGYCHMIELEQNSPMEITYKVTTAPGVEAPLKVKTTPTLMEYRYAAY